MCDTMVVVRPDRVLFAKNSDRDPNEAQVLEWHPPRTSARGATVRCTWIEIDDVPATNAVLISRPYWMWGAEMGANEYGVVIGNEAVFTREPYAERGLTGMDLVRLALERAATAEAGVATLTDLLERYGQGGGCGHERRSFTYHNSFLVADHRGAFVLETAGTRWAVERVEAGARSISNGLTIEGFAQRHSDRLRSRVSACRTRQALTEDGAARAFVPGALMQVLREHGTGGLAPDYALANGAMAAPCVHAGGLLASTQTTASWVAELRAAGPRLWATATAAPCTSIFKPVTVHDSVDLGPLPTDRFDEASLWWRHERLHRAALRDPEAALPAFAAERDAVEARWLAAPPTSAAAFAEADRLLEGWLGALPPDLADRRPRFVRRYWGVRDRRAHLPSVARRLVTR